MILLEARHLTAFYGDFQALFGVDLTLGEGELAAMVGANGAGKTTLMKRLCGLLSGAREDVFFGGEAIGDWPAHRVTRAGIALVPEGRRLFSSLTVEENLLMGLCAGRKGAWDLARVYLLFPALSSRRADKAVMLSGGQQQMCAIGRALLCNPRLLLCDEISLGLSPAIVKDIYDGFPQILAEGTSVLVVEQDIAQAMRVATRLYCLRAGCVVLQGAPDQLNRADITDAYFGTDS